MTTEITVTREGGNEDVEVQVFSKNKEGVVDPIGIPSILKSEGQSVSNHVHSAQCVVVSEVTAEVHAEPESDSSGDISDGDQSAPKDEAAGDDSSRG